MKITLFAAALALGALGCSHPCDELADKCAKCKDASTKQSCDAAVAAYRSVAYGGDTECQTVLDAKTFDSCQ